MTDASHFSEGDLRNAIDALPAALDPERLREVGLDVIRRIAAEAWTDHLAHDPGITILEALSYAVADIAYRCQFPVADLLAPKPNQPPIPNAFHLPTPRHLLTNAPVTCNDILLRTLDLPNVRNAIVTPLPTPSYPVQGLVEIRIDPARKVESEIAAALRLQPIPPTHQSDVSNWLESGSLATPGTLPQASANGPSFAIASAIGHAWGLEIQSCLDLLDLLVSTFPKPPNPDHPFALSLHALLKSVALPDAALAAHVALQRFLALPELRPRLDDPIGIIPALKAIQEAAQQRLRLMDRVERHFHEQRPAGMDLHRVIIRPPRHVLIKGTIRLAPSAPAAETLALALHNVAQFIEPVPRFLNLSQMMERCGNDASIAFDGPPLQSGFIHPDDLHPVPARLNGAAIAAVIASTPGVEDARNIALALAPSPSPLSIKTQPQWQRQLDLDTPDLINIRPVLGSVAQLDIDGVAFDPVEVQAALDRRHRSDPDPHLQPFDPDNPNQASLLPSRDRLPPVGRHRDLAHHPSLQLDFPPLYRLQPNLPDPSAPEPIRASSFQLRAFLAIMDHAIGNVLAQLANVSSLYAWPPTTPLVTRFAQGLENSIQNLHELHTAFPFPFHSDLPPTPAALSAYHQKIHEVREPSPHDPARREAFLDHLIDRFGRTPNESVVDTPSGPEDPNTAPALDRIRAKLRLLQHGARLASRRGCGTNIRSPEHSPAGLVHVLEAALGIPVLDTVVSRQRQQFIQRFIEAPSAGFNPFQPLLSAYQLKADPPSPLDYDALVRLGIDPINYQVHLVPAPEPPPTALPADAAPAPTPAEDAPTAPATADPSGADAAAVAPVPTAPSNPPPPSEPSQCWRVSLIGACTVHNPKDWPSDATCVRGHPLAQPESQVSFHLDETFPIATAADEAVKNFCRVLQHYNHHSERFEFIDHILLRPHPSEHEFRRILLGKEGTPWMQHPVPTTLAAIGSEPVSFESVVMEPFQPCPETSAAWHVCLDPLAKPEAAKAFLSIEAFPTEATAQAAIQRWSLELSRLHDEHAFQASFQPWKPNAPVPSDPYSFQATLLVPTWPTRFQQPATRRLIHQLVQREAPAHLRVHVAWLDHRAFQQFNRLLLAWKQAHQDQPTRTRQATADLRRFIARLHP